MPDTDLQTLSTQMPGADFSAGKGGRTFRRLLGMIRPWRWRIVLSVLLLLASMPCELFPAFIWKYVADDLATHNPSSPVIHQLVSFGGRVSSPYALLVWALVWLLGVYTIGALFQTIESLILQRVAQQFIFQLRNFVYGKLQSQSLGYLQRERTGDLMSRAMGDVDEVQSFVVNSIDMILGDGIMWLVTVGIVMWMDWRVASVSLAPLLAVFVMLRLFNRKVKPIYTAARERLGDVSTRLQENLSGVVVIKIFGREAQEARRFREATYRHYVQQMKAIVARSIYFPIAQGVGFFSNIFMIGLGGYLMIKEYGQPGGFTLGMLLAFRAYWWRLFGPVQTLARVNDMVQRSMAAANRIYHVIDAPEELPDSPGAVELPSIEGRLELKNVSFRYPTEPDKPGPVVIDDVSILIEPGKTVALCGPSGSGKSTILNLLLRFYDPTSGIVTLDGRNLRDIQATSLRSHFALVQQETFLFNDSILDNIRYGHAQASMEEVVAAAKAANAHEFISALPAGYDTKVGERGIRLSGGQKQRISIARAFLANPAVLLLDEPTSSVEPDSEATIISALNRLMTNRTTVLTSHRPSLIYQADMAYVIENGQVTAAGAPEDLATQGGWFGRFAVGVVEERAGVE